MTTNSSKKPLLLCLAHLGWDYVWQRPQHILSRLAAHYRVIYVNEPRLVNPVDDEYPADDQPYLQQVGQTAGLTAWQPIYPHRPEVLAQWRETYLRLVQTLLPPAGPPPILWFYTPTPYYFLEHIPAGLVVYDIMDNLAGFKGAASDLPEREAKVLAAADMVFTGGRSLYRKHQHAHPHLHLFSSGVEPEHFAQALQPHTPTAPEIAELCANGSSPQAILGYYGVIDERIDLHLLHTLAAENPHWAVVMVGPVTKIDPGQLPRLPNLHYPGMQPYERLPHFLKGFDVCLMPFALNQATHTISPTKALEYMAAHKPIVSTPIPDVVANWGEVVHIATDPAEFTTAVSIALAEPPARRAARMRLEKELLARNTWDHIAVQMHEHMQRALARKRARGQSRRASDRVASWAKN